MQSYFVDLKKKKFRAKSTMKLVIKKYKNDLHAINSDSSDYWSIIINK